MIARKPADDCKRLQLSKHPPAWGQWPGRGRRVATHHRKVAPVDGNERLLALLPRRNRIIYYVLWIIT